MSQEDLETAVIVDTALIKVMTNSISNPLGKAPRALQTIRRGCGPGYRWNVSHHVRFLGCRETEEFLERLGGSRQREAA